MGTSLFVLIVYIYLYSTFQNLFPFNFLFGSLRNADIEVLGLS